MNVNVRQDMLRQPGMPQTPMMGLGNGSFIQSQPQPQQQTMGIAPNNVPPMGMLQGPHSHAHAMNPQRYPMQMSQQQQSPPSGPQRQMMMRPPPGQPMNPAAGGSHMGPGFPPNHMMHQPGNLAARRGVSQGALNPGAPPHLSGPMQSMGMNQTPNMLGPMRQSGPPQAVPGMALRSVSAGHMSPEMGMGMGRPGGNPGMPQNINRAGSAPMPMMNGINPPSMGQPPSMQGGMPSTHQNNFHSPAMSMQHPHQHTPQLSGSPRPPPHPSQPHNMNMNMGPGPSNPGANRMPASNEAPMEFMDFSAQPFSSSQGPSNGNNQFAFVPSSTPPNQMGPRSLPSNLGGTPPSRGPFQLTPAQQFAEMQQNADNYNNNFAMPPPRPSSHNHHHSTPLQSHPPPHIHSPHSTDNMNHYPPRPHSRPQSQSGRPSSSHEPRVVQQMPPNPSMGPGPLQGRLQPQHSGPQPPQPGLPPSSSMSVSVPPHGTRPPNQPPNSNFGHGNSPASSSTMSSSDQQAAGSVPRPTQLTSQSHPPQPSQLVGQGQGLMRLLQFSGNLSSESKNKLQLSWWTELIKEYFTPKAKMKMTLWKDNQKNEAKPFEVETSTLPRFFLVTTQCGVKSMTLTLDGARERIYSPGHSVVECVAAVWTYRYRNGYTITLRGPLTAHVVITSAVPNTASQQGYVLKFEDFQFDANYHDKYISVDAIIGRILPPAGNQSTESPKTPRARNTPAPGATSVLQNGLSEHEEEDKKWEEPKVTIDKGWIPGEPVNAFGIPQATMRCLELAESVGQMEDLMKFAVDSGLGAIDALTRFSGNLRETNPALVVSAAAAQSTANGGGNAHMSQQPPYYYAPFPSSNMSSTTLYSSAPPSVTNPVPPPQAGPSTNSPQNNAPPSAHNSPQKQHKTIPVTQQTQQNTSTPTSTVNTPAMAASSLKRKQPTDTGSPSTAEAPPANKRTTRRRRTTGTGG